MKFIKDNWQIILSEGLVLLCFIMFYGRFGDVNVDSFREAFIPEQMLRGKILYKNIFTIYAPFAYQLNALLFKLFGISLKTLYFAGLAATMGIFYLVHKLARKFLDSTLTLSICLFIISALVLSPNVFNPFFPYSYGILYGLLFILLSLYAVLTKKYVPAYFFYSLAICSKYEFIFLLPLLFWAEKTRSGKINWIKDLTAVTVPAALSLIALKGASMEDIFISISLVCKMGAAKTLLWFYSSMGLTFRWELLPVYLINFVKFLIPVIWTRYQEIVIWAFPAILISLPLRYRWLNFSKKLFIIASLLISAKVFFALTLQSYGVFFLPFALISIGILTPHKWRKVLSILLLIWAIVIGGLNAHTLLQKDVEIKTQKGIIKTVRYNGKSLNKLIKYLESTDKDSKIVIYPEGLCANFLANRDSDAKFYSLIPLYVETFGEEVIIKRLEITKPDYIIISDYDTSAYYYSKFGQDYAVQVYDWIKNNYKLEKVIDGGMIFEVYKRL